MVKITINIPKNLIEAIKEVEDEDNIQDAIIAAIHYSIDNF